MVTIPNMNTIEQFICVISQKYTKVRHKLPILAQCQSMFYIHQASIVVHHYLNSTKSTHSRLQWGSKYHLTSFNHLYNGLHQILWGLDRVHGQQDGTFSPCSLRVTPIFLLRHAPSGFLPDLMAFASRHHPFGYPWMGGGDCRQEWDTSDLGQVNGQVLNPFTELSPAS